MFQLVFLIYDYALTLFIAYINRVLTKWNLYSILDILHIDDIIFSVINAQ
jgi:hypothetical protein